MDSFNADVNCKLYADVVTGGDTLQIWQVD